MRTEIESLRKSMIWRMAISILIVFSIKPLVLSQIADTIVVGTESNYAGRYITIEPIDKSLHAFMILIPGLGQAPDNLLVQTDLTQISQANGILTIIPTLQDGFVSFGIDSLSQNSLRRIINDAVERYDLTDMRFYIGGFSIGGSCAVKYAELANQYQYSSIPDAVFAIDPPLDFERFYQSRVRENRLNYPAEPSRENIFMIGKIEEIMGGSPEVALDKYHQISPYSFRDTSQQSIKTLTNTPIRLYTEPDVNWWISERGSDFSGMNSLDCSAMINELRRLGNHNAALITTLDKGYRKPNNHRHPHSWSIVDSIELIHWLQTFE